MHQLAIQATSLARPSASHPHHTRENASIPKRRICDVLDVAPTYFVPSGPDDALASVVPEGLDDDLLREASDLLRAYCRIKDPKIRRFGMLALAVAIGREGTGDDVGDPP